MTEVRRGEKGVRDSSTLRVNSRVVATGSAISGS